MAENLGATHEQEIKVEKIRSGKSIAIKKRWD